jgi:hypothetical protein
VLYSLRDKSRSPPLSPSRGGYLSITSGGKKRKGGKCERKGKKADRKMKNGDKIIK